MGRSPIDYNCEGRHNTWHTALQSRSEFNHMHATLMHVTHPLAMLVTADKKKEKRKRHYTVA